MDDFGVNIVQSGSSGNCVILNHILALDMGVTWKKVAPYSKALQLVFVGHEHGDHFKAGTIRALARERPSLRFCAGPWMISRFLAAGVPAANLDVVEAGKRYDYGGAFQIEPVELHHNVPNYGLRIFAGGKKAIYIVDTGSVTSIKAKDYDLYLLERNHTRAKIEERIAEKRAAGEYAYEEEAMRNHLSEEQALAWLAENAGPESRYIFLHQHRDGNHEE